MSILTAVLRRLPVCLFPQFFQVILGSPFRIKISGHTFLIHIETIVQVVPDAIALIRFNDSKAFIGRDLALC